MGEEVTLLPFPWGHPAYHDHHGVSCFHKGCALQYYDLPVGRWNELSAHANDLRLRAERAEAEVAKLKAQIDDIKRL